MKLIYRLLKQNPESREGVIATTSVLGIVLNLLIAGMKMVIGILSASVAIVSEGMNNLADAMTSVLTLVGTKLAGRHPTEKHPFGFGRIEYLTSLVISVLILVTGIEMLTSAIKAVFSPNELSLSYLSMAIIAGSAIIKFFFGIYTIRQGKKVGSSALVAVGIEGRNDSFVSVVTLLSTALFLVFGWNIDAYAGIFTSGIIIKAGAEVLFSTVSELLGRPGEKELATTLYNKIRSTDGILNAADMMLHNYGPDSWSGSVNVEMDHAMSVGEIYSILHKLQLRIMHEHKVTMVFGVYAVDADHEASFAIRKEVGAFVQKNEHVKSFHAVYIEPETEKIYCDLVVDYKLKDWDALRKEFLSYMKGFHPNNEIELVIETEFV